MEDRMQLGFLNPLGTMNGSPIKAHTEMSSSYKTPLHEAFLPGQWDVLCCGGKEGSEHGTFL